MIVEDMPLVITENGTNAVRYDMIWYGTILREKTRTTTGDVHV